MPQLTTVQEKFILHWGTMGQQWGINRTVAQILSRQLGDGGFGMWPEAAESSEWVTPYALWVLEKPRIDDLRRRAA